MSEKEELRPDKEWLKGQMLVMRTSKYQRKDSEPRRVNAELTLLNIETQEKLQATLERSIKSQDRLANTQNALTVVGVVIALLQLVGMFILPNL